MAPSTARTPSLSRGSLCRQSSTIRTGCANERPSGSARGVPREWYPYRDPRRYDLEVRLSSLQIDQPLVDTVGGKPLYLFFLRTGGVGTAPKLIQPRFTRPKAPLTECCWLLVRSHDALSGRRLGRK